jgi:hypothetical protein
VYPLFYLILFLLFLRDLRATHKVAREWRLATYMQPLEAKGNIIVKAALSGSAVACAA